MKSKKEPFPLFNTNESYVSIVSRLLDYLQIPHSLSDVDSNSMFSITIEGTVLANMFIYCYISTGNKQIKLKVRERGNKNRYAFNLSSPTSQTISKLKLFKEYVLSYSDKVKSTLTKNQIYSTTLNFMSNKLKILQTNKYVNIFSNMSFNYSTSEILIKLNDESFQFTFKYSSPTVLFVCYDYSKLDSLLKYKDEIANLQNDVFSLLNQVNEEGFVDTPMFLLEYNKFVASKQQ